MAGSWPTRTDTDAGTWDMGHGAWGVGRLSRSERIEHAEGGRSEKRLEGAPSGTTESRFSGMSSLSGERDGRPVAHAHRYRRRDMGHGTWGVGRGAAVSLGAN